MRIADALARYAIAFSAGLAVALVLGVLLGLREGADVRDGLAIAFYIVGALAFVLGVMGVASPSRRETAQSDWHIRNLPMFRDREHPGSANISDSVVFFAVALTMAALGVWSG